MVTSFLLIALSGAFKASSDVCLFRYNRSIFKGWRFFNQEESWKNKYKSDLKTPRFFGSTTFFVIFTDWMHLGRAFEMLFLFSSFYFLPIDINNKIFMFVLLWVTRNVTFELFFEHIFTNR